MAAKATGAGSLFEQEVNEITTPKTSKENKIDLTIFIEISY
jgi:hypothetical protein